MLSVVMDVVSQRHDDDNIVVAVAVVERRCNVLCCLVHQRGRVDVSLGVNVVIRRRSRQQLRCDIEVAVSLS